MLSGIIRLFLFAGDILVNSSLVEYNQDNGVNITYDGGWRMFNRSSFSFNYGNGINITFNETSVDNRTRYTRQQRTHVSWSNFTLNDGYGVRVGNYCRAGEAFVNNSIFVGNSKSAVEFESCFHQVPNQNATNFTVGYNVFISNRDYAIKIAPLLNAVGIIANNTFRNHSRYVVLLDNANDFVMNEYFLTMKVDYNVITNIFEDNSGFYVASFRLTQGSPVQKMIVNYNRFLGNTIEGSCPTLNQRTMAYAVVLLSSNNVNFSRNHLENPASKYEIATQLLDMSVTLHATMQWWGMVDYTHIIMRIFDQFNRYNLALIKYHPALTSDWLYTPVLSDRSIEIQVQFMRGANLGGRLYTELHTTPGMTYSVDRDLSVMDLGRLYVTGGTILEFENALGMLVNGYVSFQGSVDRPIVLRLKNETTWVNNSLVRLVDGPNLMEGRLEVRPTELDDWGTICNIVSR